MSRMDEFFWPDQSKKAGIYCHIPFCIKKCAYCDFNSQVCQDEKIINVYFEAFKKELLLFARHKKIAVDTIYFGGGTPSAVPAVKIKEVMILLKSLFEVSETAEVTIEINPGTIDEEKLQIYQEIGINRVSVGFQAWQNQLLQVLGRVHDQRDFIKTMEELKKVAFTNISVDLMYGIPGQTLEMMKATLEAVVNLGPQHFSCYSLILEEGTLLTQKVNRGLLAVPEEDDERRMHWLIHEFLKKEGFKHYEISSYAKSGYESQHNLKYWEMTPYLGFGLGAHGFYQGVRYGNEGNYENYLALIKAGQEPRPKEAPLTKKEAMSEWMFLGLRKLAGVDNRDFQKLFQMSFFELYGQEIDELIDRKLLVREENCIRLTKHGQDFGNQVFGMFI